MADGKSNSEHGADEPQQLWFVAHTKPRCEKKLFTQCQRDGIDATLPCYDSAHNSRGKVVIFRANQCYTTYMDAGPTLGWKDHVEGEIRCVEIDGSHISMMSDPGLSVLIEHLRTELARPEQKLATSQ